MTMSGWASHDKQPWRLGEPTTSIARRFLKLKSRLLPYMYTLVREAHDTGVAPVRPLLLEFFDDSHTHTNATMYQFMSGPAFLVAPVYTNTTTRSDIYLPGGEWIDFNTEDRLHGPATLPPYPVPIDTLPVFVKGGAIVPLGPAMNHWGQQPLDPVTLALYPSAQAPHTSFALYEDDAISRNFATQHAWQAFNMSYTEAAVVVEIGASIGEYKGKPASRAYELELHWPAAPKAVSAALHEAAPVPLKEYPSLVALARAATGWCWVADAKQTVVKIGKLPTSHQGQVFLRFKD